MPRAIRIHETGGPEVLRWEEVPLGTPSAGEVLLRQTAVGLNYIDTYHRTGLYPLALPAILGREAAGVVEAIGTDVDSLEVGDRVAYALEAGSYCERRTIAADRLVRLPDSIDDRTAAAMMLKGLTAQYLLRHCYHVEAGDTILIHAAAGGVGLIACQWARSLGATVIGTVGSAEKAELASRHGCDHPILYKEQDFVERVRELTHGAGVQAVYDSVGRDTFDGSLDCLERRGMLVSFGQSSGPVEPLNIGVLAAKGSLNLTRPTLAHFIATKSELDRAAKDLLDLHAAGSLSIEIGRTYPLSEASQAHRDLGIACDLGFDGIPPIAGTFAVNPSSGLTREIENQSCDVDGLSSEADLLSFMIDSDNLGHYGRSEGGRLDGERAMGKTKATNRRFFTTTEIANYCTVSNDGVLKWIKSGKLQAFATPGGHYRISAEAFREFLTLYSFPIQESFFSSTQESSRTRVLVVIDEPNQRAALMQRLREINPLWDLDEAGDGYEAGIKIGAKRPHLVVLDLKMPRVDGLSLCRSIRGNPDTSSMRILAVARNPDEKTRSRALRAGADICLPKPVEYEPLRRAVSRLLGRSVPRRVRPQQRA